MKGLGFRIGAVLCFAYVRTYAEELHVDPHANLSQVISALKNGDTLFMAPGIYRDKDCCDITVKSSNILEKSELDLGAVIDCRSYSRH
jgi:hypothetical protein